MEYAQTFLFDYNDSRSWKVEQNHVRETWRWKELERTLWPEKSEKRQNEIWNAFVFFWIENHFNYFN